MTQEEETPREQDRDSHLEVFISDPPPNDAT